MEKRSMRKSAGSVLLSVLLGVLMQGAVAEDVRYFVDVDASGAEDGTTWTDAFVRIQDAVDAASAGGEIWVAEGSYSEFVTLGSGIALYGGFVGVETDLEQRDWETYATEIDVSEVHPGGDATHHVVVMNGVVDSTLDGFGITGGSSDTFGAGLYCVDADDSNTISNCSIYKNEAASGGGVYFSGASPRLIHCTISGNRGLRGAGAYFDTNSSPVLERCVVSGNYGGSGCGVFCHDNVSPTFVNCEITGNLTTEDGGAVYCWESAPRFINCTIAGNTTYGSQGSALYLHASDLPGDSPDRPAFTNCIVQGNTGIAFVEASGAPDPLATNCIFHGNAGGDWYDDDTATAVTGASAINALPEADACVDGNSLFQMNGSQAIHGTWTAVSYNASSDITTFTDVAASFVPDALIGRFIEFSGDFRWEVMVVSNTTTSIQVLGDNTLWQAGDSYVVVDYHILSGSAAIDSGTNVDAPATDIDGETRPQGSAVDIGADEFVDTDGDGLSDWFERGFDGDVNGYSPYPGGQDLDFDNADTDGDGGSDYIELSLGSNPLSSDEPSVPAATLWGLALAVGVLLTTGALVLGRES